MSKVEIEKAKERSRKLLIAEEGNIKAPIFLKDLDLLLKALDNSISKERIKDIIKKHKERIEPYQNKKNLTKIEKAYIERISNYIEILQVL